MPRAYLKTTPLAIPADYRKDKAQRRRRTEGAATPAATQSFWSLA
jgi:hypothetical protein